MGYDLNRFAISVDPILCCKLCGGVLDNPVLFDCPARNELSILEASYSQTHIFCRNCLLDKLSTNSSTVRCPVDSKAIKKSARNKNLIQSAPVWIISELNKLRVSCDFFGCKSFFSFNELDLHRAMCEYNPHRTATPSLHMLDASNHLNNLNNLNNYSAYHRPSPISTPAPASIMNQMQAVSGQSSSNSLPNSLQSSLAQSSTGLHHGQTASTWYNDFDNWSMYDHQSMVNQMNAANQSTLNSSLNQTTSQSLHHSLPMTQQHLNQSNGSMFAPTSQTSLSNSLPKQSQFASPTPNQTNGNLSSPHPNQPITPIPQHHSTSVAIQQSTHPSLLNQHSQYNSNQFTAQHSSFVSPQKQSNSIQSSNLQIAPQPMRNSKHPMPVPSPGPFNSSLVNPGLLKSDLEKVVDSRIQQLDDRINQNLEEIRNFLKQKQDIETNNFETEKFKNSLADLRQQLDSLRKTNELTEMKFDEKLNERESELRKLLDGCVCKNGSNQAAVSTSSSKPLKKQKRHFDNGLNGQNEDDCSPEEQNELSSTVDTPVEQSTDLELVNQKVQFECEKYLQSNLPICLEKSGYLKTVDDQIERELNVFRTQIEQQFDRQFKDLNTKITKLDDGLTSSLTNKCSQKIVASEKKILKETEEQSLKMRRQLDDQVKQIQKELKSVRQENSKQKVEIEQLRTLLAKYEKLYCDEQLEDEDPSSSDAEKYEIVEDEDQKSDHKMNGRAAKMVDDKESNKKESHKNQQKNECNVQRNKTQRKRAKIANLSMNLRKTVSSEKKEVTNPIKARLRRSRDKRSESFESLDSLVASNEQSEVNKEVTESEMNKNKTTTAESIEKTIRKDLRRNSKKRPQGEEEENNKTVITNEIVGEDQEGGSDYKESKLSKSSEQVKKSNFTKETKSKDNDNKNDEDVNRKEETNETKVKEHLPNEGEESPDLLAKIVNEVLFPESEQGTSHNYNSSSFTFASQQPNPTILRPFFDASGIGLNSNKFIVSLTRTINQPTAQQMLLVNSNSHSLVTTTSSSNLSTTVTPSTSQSAIDETNSNDLKSSFQLAKTSIITSTTSTTTKANAKTKQTNTPSKTVAKKQDEEPEKVSKKRSSSRLSVKKNDSESQIATPVTVNESSNDLNQTNQNDTKNSIKKRSAECDKPIEPPVDGKRKRRKINETIHLNDPKLANIKLTTQSRKKGRPAGESILMDVPSSSSSTSSSYAIRKPNTKRKASTSKYQDGFDSATDCEEDDFQSIAISRKSIEQGKKIRMSTKEASSIDKKKDKKASSNKISSTSEDRNDDLDEEKDEISSSTDRIKDSEPKKKRKKVNDYVKRRRPKSILANIGSTKSLPTNANLNDKQESSKRVDLLEDILSAIDNVVAGGVAEEAESSEEKIDMSCRKATKSNKSNGRQTKAGKQAKADKNLKKSTRATAVKETKESKETEKEKLEVIVKEKKKKSNGSKKSIKKSESLSSTSASKSTLVTSKANKDNELSETISTSFSKEETDEIFFEMIGNNTQPDSIIELLNAKQIKTTNKNETKSTNTVDPIIDSFTSVQEEIDRTRHREQSVHEDDVLKDEETVKNQIDECKDDSKNGSPVRDLYETINDIITIIESSSNEEIKPSCKLLPNKNCTTDHSTNGSNAKDCLESLD